MKEKVLNIETVHQCNCCLGNKTLHPLVSAIDLSRANVMQRTIRFDFYTVLLLDSEYGDTIYGRKYYDYSNATMIFLAPGESININQSKALPRKGWLLVFHPDFLCGTSLGRNINGYSFFSYHLNEALHLSLRERNKAAECFGNIEEELQHAIDCHSKVLISKYIELLLDYCSRFYDRQFITRNEVNKTILAKTDKLLDDYIRCDGLKSGKLPSVKYCADILHLSPHYFNDLLKFETGKNMDEYFQLMRMETGKKMMMEKENTVGLVARKLGYPSVQYFSNLFKKLVGVTPNEYRLLQN